jgi:uncharacterized protein involved in exopolysaccharide biosynthesis
LRRVPVVVAGALLGPALALAVVTRPSPSYEAQAALLVELAPELEGPASPDLDATEGLPLLEQRLRARALSAEAASHAVTGVAPARQARPAAATPSGATEAPTSQPDAALARIVTVGLRAPSPQLAAAATNEIAGLLLREAAERRRGEASAPVAPDEVERLARDVASQAAVLREFLAEHAQALPDTADARQSRLATEEARLEELARADAALPDPPAADGAPQTGSSAADSSDDLATHRDLVARQRTEAEARITELSASLAATPGNAEQLATLRREFDALRSEFDRVTQEVLAAQAGDLLELLVASPRVSVIALAVPPAAPAGPNRVLILGAGLLGGLLLGLALAALIESRDRSIRHPEELAIRLGIKPFAVLPVLRNGRGRSRRLGVWALFLLVLLAAGLLATHVWIMPLDLRLGWLRAVMDAAGRDDG